jgi:hypothetical protein
MFEFFIQICFKVCLIEGAVLALRERRLGGRRASITYFCPSIGVVIAVQIIFFVNTNLLICEKMRAEMKNAGLGQ